MAKWEVKYTHVIERKVTALVEADSEEEAIQKGAHQGDVLNSDEDCAPEDGLEIKDEEARELTEEESEEIFGEEG